MKNGVLVAVALVVALVGFGFVAYRLGISTCRESVASEAEKIQQVVQESDRNIRRKVLGTAHSDNLNWLLSEFKRAD